MMENPMKKKTIVKGIIASGAGLALATTVSAQANGEPQRSSKTPPGLEKALSKLAPGIMRALARTDGSNSRLQDLPVSP